MIAGASLLLVTLVLVFLLGPMIASGPLEGRLISKLGQRVRGEVSIDDLGLGWFSGVSLRGLRIVERDGDEAVVEIDRASGSPELLPLLRGAIVVRGARVDGVTLRAERVDGRWNLADLFVTDGDSDGGGGGGGRQSESPGAPRKKRPGTLPQTTKPVTVPRLDIDAVLENVTLHLTDGARRSTLPAIDRLDVHLRPGKPVRMEYSGLEGLKASGEVVLFDGDELLAQNARTANFLVEADDYDITTLTGMSRTAGVPSSGAQAGPRPWRGLLDTRLNVTLAGGDIRVKGVAGARDLEEAARRIASIDASIDLRMPLGKGAWPRGTVSLSTGAMRFDRAAAANALQLSGVEASLAIDAERQVTIDSCRVRSEIGEVDVTGSVSLPQTPGPIDAADIESALAIVGSIDLARLMGLVADRDGAGVPPGSAPRTGAGGDASDVIGRMTLEGTVATESGAQIVRLTGTGSEVRVTTAGGETFDLGSPSLACDLTLRRESIEIGRLGMKLGATSATASGTLDRRPSASPSGTLGIEATTSVAELRALLGDRIPDELAAELRFEGTVSPGERLDFDLGVLGNKTRFGADDRAKPFSARLTGWREPASGVVEIPQARLSMEGAKGTGSIRFTPGDSLAIRGDFDLVLEQTMRAFARFIPEGISARGPGALQFEGTVPLGGESGFDASAVKLDVRSSARRLELPGLGMKDATLVVNVADGVIEVSEGKAEIEGGTATFAGQLQYGVEPPLLFASLNATDIGVAGDTQFLMSRSVPIFAGLGAVVRTRVGAALELSASGRDVESLLASLRGKGAVSCASGTVGGNSELTNLLAEIGVDEQLEFEPFKTAFRIQDGSVLQDPFTIRSRRVDLRMAGVATLDGRLDYSIDVKPRGESAKNVRRYARILGADGFIPFGLRGSIRTPSLITPDPGDIVENVLDGLLKQGIDELLDRDKKDEDRKRRRNDDGRRDRKKNDGKDPGGS